MSTRWSPSKATSPRRRSAKRSCQPGGGGSRQNFSQCSALARMAKRHERMTNGPRSTFSMRPATTVMRYCVSPTSTMNVSFMRRPQRTIAGSAFTRSAMLSIMSLRPRRSMGPERRRWPAPVWRCVRKLHNGAQVADRARRRVHLAHQRLQLRLRQVRRNFVDGVLGQEAAVRDPFAYACERYPHEPAAAFTRAALERNRGAEGHEVAAYVVDGGYGEVLRPAVLRRERGHAAHRLHDAVEAAPGAPGPSRVPSRERYAYDAGTQRGERFRREAPRRERRGPVRLGKDVALQNEALERSPVLRAPEVELRRQLADAGIDIHRTRAGQMGGADLQNVGAMLGQAARARRAREHAGKVEHADPFEGSCAFRHFFGRRVCDPHDLDERARRDGNRLRVPLPIHSAAHEAGAASGGVDRVFE